MILGPIHPGLTIFVGRFGSGKTETAINYALGLARNGSHQGPAARPVAYEWEYHLPGERFVPEGVLLIDLDIVTPYFRSREATVVMAEQGVRVVAPSIVGQHLDLPAITPQILGAIQQPEHQAVLDVGGDKQGARALGQFSWAIQERGYRMLFVVNPYRPFTGTLQGLAGSVAEIETSSRLQVTGLVSNPNLTVETTMDDIVQGNAKIEGYARELGMPIAFVCIERRWADDLDPRLFAEPILLLDRYFVMSWE
jgi:hypothetical protein